MLSSCSNGSLSQEMSVFSMWMDATQMLSLATAHRRRVGRMRQRMAMWLQEGSRSQSAELQYLRLARSGLELSWRSLETSFLNLSRSWILGHFAAHSDLYELTPTGDIDQLSIRTSVPEEFLSARTSFQNWATGYNEIWQDLLLVSVPSLASSGGPPVIVWLGVYVMVLLTAPVGPLASLRQWPRHGIGAVPAVIV